MAGGGAADGGVRRIAQRFERSHTETECGFGIFVLFCGNTGAGSFMVVSGGVLLVPNEWAGWYLHI